jgi:hypothetical protein
MKMPAIYLDDFDQFLSNGLAVRGDFPDIPGTTDKWVLVENVCGAHNRRLLCASAHDGVPNLVFQPKVRGRFAIHVSFFNLEYHVRDIGIYVRMGDDPHFARFVPERVEPVFQNVLFKVADLNESSRIEIGAMGTRVFLNCIKLVPVEPVALPKPTGRLIGICDTPVNLREHRPVGREAASMVRLHKDAGFDLILWKVLKVVCEYPTKVGVRRDMGVPYDTLRQAVDEAKKIGIDLYGWFRISNEDSKKDGLFGPTTPFHLAHPEKRQVSKSGVVRPRMSFAYPEVRQHKIDMIKEVVAYGVDGICIDVLRQPPMALYDLPLVEAFIQETGQDPRQMPGDGTEEWLKFRCEPFTQFLREARAAMDKLAGRRLPLMVRTFDQPWRNMQAGCDVEAWLDEKLVDSILFAPHLPVAEFPPRIGLCDWVSLVRRRACVFGQVWRYGSTRDAEILAGELYDQGAQGIAIYESEMAIQRPSLWGILWRFRRPDRLCRLAAGT